LLSYGYHVQLSSIIYKKLINTNSYLSTSDIGTLGVFAQF